MVKAAAYKTSSWALWRKTRYLSQTSAVLCAASFPFWCSSYSVSIGSSSKHNVQKPVLYWMQQYLVCLHILLCTWSVLPHVTFATCLKVAESLPWKHKAIINSGSIPKLLKHKNGYKHTWSSSSNPGQHVVNGKISNSMNKSFIDMISKHMTEITKDL